MSNPSFGASLKGKVAFILGSVIGIGFAIALKAAELGVHIALVDIGEANLCKPNDENIYQKFVTKRYCL